MERTPTHVFILNSIRVILLQAVPRVVRCCSGTIFLAEFAGSNPRLEARTTVKACLDPCLDL